MSIYVFDASTVVSAALSSDGLPRRALITARLRGTIALSKPVYDEISHVLARPKFVRFIDDDRRREILELLVTAAAWLEPTEQVADCRDAKDNMYLALAVAAGAKAIVSGDDDLLVLDPWRGIRILGAADFLAQDAATAKD